MLMELEEVDIADEYIAPEQFFPLQCCEWQPEQWLAFAVLQDALRDYGVLPSASKPRWLNHQRRREAEQWIRDIDEHWPFSFVNICRMLGIEPEMMRRRIFR